MIDIFTYQVAESARNIIYERQRYLEGASSFWDPERESSLNDLLELFRSEGFTPRLELPTDTKNPVSLEKMLSYLQSIIDNYNEVAVPNVISPSIREAYEKHLTQLELENKKTSVQKTSSLSSSLKTILPSASPALIKEVSLLIENTTNQQGIEAGLEQAVHILSNVSKITSTPLDNSTIALALTPLSPNIDSLLGTNSPDLSHRYALVSSVLFGEVKSPSPQTLSSLPLKVPQIQTFVKDLTDPLSQLNSLYQNSKRDLHTATGLLASLIQATSKLDTPNPAEKLVLAQTLFEISPLVNYVYHNTNSTQKSAKLPASQAQFQEFLVHMGLDFAGSKGFQASSRSISAAISASLGTIFTPSAQTYYAGRATSSPYFKQFLVAYEAATAIGTSKNDKKTSSKPSHVSSNSFNQGMQNLQEQLSYLFSRISSFVSQSQKDNVDLTDPVLNMGMLAGSIGLIIVPILIPTAPFLLVPIGGAISIYSIHRLITITTVTKHSPAQTFNNFITNIFAGVVAMLSGLFLFIGIIVLSIPIVIALILFIINSSALVVPPNDSTFNLQSDITPPNEQIACTTTVTPLGLPVPSNSVAAKALKIVDNLKQGFWCYWNNSPDYPNLFNYSEYSKYPFHCVYRPGNPSGCSGSYTVLDGNSLFWCTWLVIKAYENVGVPSLELGANAMMNSWFKDKGKLIYNTSGLVTNNGAKVSPGDIAFINTPGDPSGYAGHVAIVYAVTSDFVMTVDSNAATKTHSYTVETNGSLQPQYGLSVIGFGRLP